MGLSKGSCVRLCSCRGPGTTITVDYDSCWKRYNRTEDPECALLSTLASLASLASRARSKLPGVVVGGLAEPPGGNEADETGDALGVPLAASNRFAALPRPDVAQPHADMLLALGSASWTAAFSATRSPRCPTLRDSSSRRCGLLPGPLLDELGIFHGIFSSHGT